MAGSEGGRSAVAEESATCPWVGGCGGDAKEAGRGRRGIGLARGSGGEEAGDA